MSSLHPDIERVALLGWRVLPARNTSRAMCFKGALDAATSDLEQLERWSHVYPDCRWQIVMQGSGIWCLDVDRAGPDHDGDGFAALADLIAQNAPLPDRPTTISGGGGCALFFRDAGNPVRGKSGWPSPGLDPRIGRLTITIPPSRHLRTKLSYRWKVAPWEVQAPVAPSWLLRAVAPPPEPKRREIVPSTEKARIVVIEAMHQVERAPSGSANDTLNRAAYRLGVWCASGTLHASDASEALLTAAQRRAIPPHEARATIKSGLAAGQRRGANAHVG